MELDWSFVSFFVIGFVAQMLDGSMGMGFGITANVALISMGMSPVLSSANVHLAAIFTTGVSGLSHWRFGNIERKLLRRLIIPGVIGGVIGAYFLTSVNPEWVNPIVGIYLFLIGAAILHKSKQKTKLQELSDRFKPFALLSDALGLIHQKIHPKGKQISLSLTRVIGFFGGLTSSIGGGGWGPIVTSTLIAKGHSPRYSIGSANMAEFFLAVFASAVFIVALPAVDWQAIVGLLAGGVVGAPLAAWIAKHLPTKALMVAVGILVMVVSGFLLWEWGKPLIT